MHTVIEGNTRTDVGKEVTPIAEFGIRSPYLHWLIQKMAPKAFELICGNGYEYTKTFYMSFALCMQVPSTGVAKISFELISTWTSKLCSQFMRLTLRLRLHLESQFSCGEMETEVGLTNWGTDILPNIVTILYADANIMESDVWSKSFVSCCFVTSCLNNYSLISYLFQGENKLIGSCNSKGRRRRRSYILWLYL